MDVSGFDWDDGNRDKCQKHGVSIAEIEQVLSGTPRVVPDLKHSDIEDRFIAVGRARQMAGRFSSPSRSACMETSG